MSDDEERIFAAHMARLRAALDETMREMRPEMMKGDVIVALVRALHQSVGEVLGIFGVAPELYFTNEEMYAAHDASVMTGYQVGQEAIAAASRPAGSA